MHEIWIDHNHEKCSKNGEKDIELPKSEEDEFMADFAFNAF